MEITGLNPKCNAQQMPHNLTEAYHVVVNTEKGLTEIIKVRITINTGISKFATVWVFGQGEPVSGTGKASGYGYDKSSAALEAALINAGFEFDGYVSSIRGALDLMAQYLGHDDVIILEA